MDLPVSGAMESWAKAGLAAFWVRGAGLYTLWVRGMGFLGS